MTRPLLVLMNPAERMWDSALDLEGPEQKMLLDLLETKVRHVRTASGAERFDLPIGSPIVAHPAAPKNSLLDKLRAELTKRGMNVEPRPAGLDDLKTDAKARQRLSGGPHSSVFDDPAVMLAFVSHRNGLAPGGKVYMRDNNGKIRSFEKLPGSPLMLKLDNGRRATKVEFQTIIDASRYKRSYVPALDEDVPAPATPKVIAPPTQKPPPGKPAKLTGLLKPDWDAVTRTSKKIAPSKAVTDRIASQRVRFDGKSFADWDTEAGSARFVDVQARDITTAVISLQNDLKRLRRDHVTWMTNSGSHPAQSPYRRDIANAEGELAQIKPMLDVLHTFGAIKNPVPSDAKPLYQIINDGKPGDSAGLMNVFNNLVVEVPAFKHDANNRSIPPESFLRSLDSLKILGKEMRLEITEFQDADPEVKRLTECFREMHLDKPEEPLVKYSISPNAERAEQDQYKRELKLWERKYRVADNPNIDPEFVTLGKLATREKQITLEYMNKIRPMGPHREATPYFLDTRNGSPFMNNAEAKISSSYVMSGEEVGSAALYQQTVEQGLEIYPTSWVAMLPDKYYHRGWSDRAFNGGPEAGADYTNPPITPKPPILALETPGGDGVEVRDVQTGFDNYGAQVAAHELGHSMQSFVPGISALEWSELYDRAGRNRQGGVWEPTRHLGAHYNAHEHAIEDDFTNPYAGKSYLGEDETGKAPHKQGWELITTGVEDMFGATTVIGQDGTWAVSTKRTTKPTDHGVQELILGMMASLNYFDDEEGWRTP